MAGERLQEGGRTEVESGLAPFRERPSKSTGPTGLVLFLSLFVVSTGCATIHTRDLERRNRQQARIIARQLEEMETLMQANRELERRLAEIARGSAKR